jgi:uncharacterized protein
MFKTLILVEEMRLFCLLSFLIFAVLPAAHAETVVLKNGSTFKGTVTEKNTQKINIEVSGVPLTYYLDEIESVDGRKPIDYVKDTSQKLMTDLPAYMTQPPAPTPTPVPVVKPAPMPSKAPIQAAAGMSKKQLILKFIDVFGTKESMTTNFEDLLKRAPPNQVEELKKAINVDEIIEQLVPIYDQHFTEQELIAYISFYTSPEGKKLLKTIPALMEESVGVSLKYFKEKLAKPHRI